MWVRELSMGYYSHTTTLPKFMALLWVTLTLTLTRSLATALRIAQPNCTNKCGNISIPYPFGIEEGCYYKDPVGPSYYNLSCNNSVNPPVLRFGTIQVVKISLDGEIRLRNRVSYNCYYDPTKNKGYFPSWINSWKFTISTTQNSLVAVGCATYVWFNGTSTFAKYADLKSGCMTLCNKEQLNILDDKCSGIGCCKAFLPSGLNRINISAYSYNYRESVLDFNPCSVAFVVANDAMPSYRDLLHKDITYLYNLSYPVVYNWSIGTKHCKDAKLAGEEYICKGNSTCVDIPDQEGYRCQCLDGFQGNPHLDDCQDVDECVREDLNECEKPAICVNTIGSYNCSCPQGYYGNGTKLYPCFPYNHGHRRNKLLIGGLSVTLGSILLVLAGWWLNLLVKRKKASKQRAKYFKKNGGLILLQQTSSDGSGKSRVKMFTPEELEKATDGFNKDRILGEGGQGTVYKGMLSEGKLVAIKMAKIVDENQSGDFINEVVILWDINHRNIVKLLGCCLETEVPLLVYEFIPNGTLFQLIHHPNKEFVVTWRMRLQIASDSAGALSYLHSSYSVPILHRDIKSSNILLDDKYRAKLSDFGTSKSIAIDQTHAITRVVGTFGYLDPEYFHTGRFSEKSDVYSFGVVLVELLTGQRAVRATIENKSLASWFLSQMENSRLMDIIDAPLLKEGSEEEFHTIACVAKQCLQLDGRNRPTMKEVLIKIEGVLSLHEPQQNWPETKQVLTGAAYYDENSTMSTFNLENNSASSSEMSLLYNLKV